MAKEGSSSSKKATRFLTEAEFRRLMRNGYVVGFHPLRGTFSHPLQDGIIGDQICNPTYSGNNDNLTAMLYAGGKKKSNEAVVAEDNYFHSIFPIFRIKQAIAFVNLFKMFHVKAAGIEWQTPPPPATSKKLEVVLQKKAVVKLALQPGFTWCFSNCSHAVHGMVTIIGRYEKTRNRIGQLIGWHSTISLVCTSAGHLCNRVIDVFCWYDTIQSAAWKGMGAKMDTRKDLAVQCQQHWRSHVANTELHVLKLLWIVAYDLERIAFNEKTNNALNHKISLAVQFLMQAMSEFPLHQELEMLRSTINKARYHLAKQAENQGFRPYRYFLGSDGAPGTGKEAPFFTRTTVDNLCYVFAALLDPGMQMILALIFHGSADDLLGVLSSSQANDTTRVPGLSRGKFRRVIPRWKPKTKITLNDVVAAFNQFLASRGKNNESEVIPETDENSVVDQEVVDAADLWCQGLGLWLKLYAPSVYAALAAGADGVDLIQTTVSPLLTQESTRKIRSNIDLSHKNFLSVVVQGMVKKQADWEKGLALALSGHTYKDKVSDLTIDPDWQKFTDNWVWSHVGREEGFLPRWHEEYIRNRIKLEREARLLKRMLRIFQALMQCYTKESFEINLIQPAAGSRDEQTRQLIDHLKNHRADKNTPSIKNILSTPPRDQAVSKAIRLIAENLEDLQLMFRIFASASESEEKLGMFPVIADLSMDSTDTVCFPPGARSSLLGWINFNDLRVIAQYLDGRRCSESLPHLLINELYNNMIQAAKRAQELASASHDLDTSTNGGASESKEESGIDFASFMEVMINSLIAVRLILPLPRADSDRAGVERLRLIEMRDKAEQERKLYYESGLWEAAAENDLQHYQVWAEHPDGPIRVLCQQGYVEPNLEHADPNREPGNAQDSVHTVHAELQHEHDDRQVGIAADKQRGSTQCNDRQADISSASRQCGRPSDSQSVGAMDELRRRVSIPIGINNPPGANLCYMISTLQVNRHVSSICGKLFPDKYLFFSFQALACTGPLVTASKGLHDGPACNAVHRLIIALAKGVGPSQRTRWERSALDELRAALQPPFHGLPNAKGRQEDAHEFLLKTDELLPSICFEIKETEQMTCTGCGARSDQTVASAGILLSIPGANDIPDGVKYTNPFHHTWSLKEWVKTYYQRSEVVVRHCSNCEGSTSLKKVCTHSAPDILRIILKYFGIEGSNSKPTRRWSEYESVELELPGTQVKAKYRLYGIIFHHGRFVRSGHYTFAGCGSGCAGRESCDGQIVMVGGSATGTCASSWFHCNDGTVEGPCTMESACTFTGGRKGKSQPEIATIGSDNKAPYILFYTRLADTSSGFVPQAPDSGFCTRGYEWRQALE